MLSVAIFSFVATPTIAVPDTVRLSNATWTLDIVPASLAVTAYPAGETTAVPLSVPHPALGGATEFSQDGNTLRWRLPARSLTVRLELLADSLSVEFTQDPSTQTESELTWPTVSDFDALRAYILPLFEGSYVPKGDKKWQRFLMEQSPMNTTAGLAMPFWGVDLGTRTLTYILTNPFNNKIRFNGTTEGALDTLDMSVTHTFTRNRARGTYGVRVSLDEGSPVAPAKRYRRFLQEKGEFVSFAEKMERLPAAEKLLGAPHVYLWGSDLLSRYDVTDWKRFAAELTSDTPLATHVRTHLNAEAQQLIAEMTEMDFISKYARQVVSRSLSEYLSEPDFYRPALWADVPLSSETLDLLARDVASLTRTALYRRNCLLLYAAFPDLLRHPDTWGDGLSLKLLDRFTEAGLDRLWLGVDTWQHGFRHPTAVAKARELGYLVGPYDSYHSIHHPDEQNTWETAQFDLALYRSGAIVNADGTKSRGFKKKGYHLSPLIAQPYVEARVNGILAQMPADFNTWFIDCDAYGELYDDYDPAHPATQLDDMNARLARMAWIRDTHGMVIGSEGGSAYAAATIHFAHGMMTSVIGWGDPDMKSKTSPYYVGGYWPPEGPAVHIKQVPLKDHFFYLYFDPCFRLPLYQTVFHDSVITTNHWGAGSLKFTNVVGTLALLELLYNVPPLYHLNMAEFSKHEDWIKRHYAFFSPLHRQIGGQPMTDFEWLSADRLVQRTVFGGGVEMIANFGSVVFEHKGTEIPARTIRARHLSIGETTLFSVE